MVTKKTKGKQAAAPADKTRALWLAGVGALSLAQKRGGEMLGGLIAEGHDLQQRALKIAQEVSADAKKQVHGALAPVRENLKKGVAQFGVAVQQGVAGVLAKLGIPSKADIEQLTRQVAALSKQLRTAKVK